jgi:hypothetical protein
VSVNDPGLSPEPPVILLVGRFASDLVSGGCGGGDAGSGGGADAFFFKDAGVTFVGHPTGVFGPGP